VSQTFKWILFVAAVFLVATSAQAATKQAASTDPEIIKGVKQVEEGDYDAAIVTLDAAARRLAQNPTRSQELSTAYLYLGIAYVGKGHEAAAKAKFREALERIKDLSLSPDKYPPKVINLFEAARAEASRGGTTAAPPSKGKSKSKLLLISGGIVVAGGAAVLLTTKSDEGPDPSAYASRHGVLTSIQPTQEYVFGPGGEGVWTVDLSWYPEGQLLIVQAFDQGNQIVGESRQTSSTASNLQFNGQSGAVYRMLVLVPGGAKANVEFDIYVSYPKPTP
jgi:tetratricopeptide (TPR) repeat protein